MIFWKLTTCNKLDGLIISTCHHFCQMHSHFLEWKSTDRNKSELNHIHIHTKKTSLIQPNLYNFSNANRPRINDMDERRKKDSHIGWHIFIQHTAPSLFVYCWIQPCSVFLTRSVVSFFFFFHFGLIFSILSLPPLYMMMMILQSRRRFDCLSLRLFAILNTTNTHSYVLLQLGFLNFGNVTLFYNRATIYAIVFLLLLFLCYQSK